MTSARKIRANRANALHSTGPRTAAGLAVAGGNARRHGLAIPVSSDPALSAEVEALARKIAPDGSPVLLDHARKIAAAQVDLMRIRRARTDLIARASEDMPAYVPEEMGAAVLELAKKMGNSVSSRGKDMRELFRLAHERVVCLFEEQDLLWNKFELGKELIAIDRYERRAFSRRKSAIRAFDAACLRS